MFFLIVGVKVVSREDWVFLLGVWRRLISLKERNVKVDIYLGNLCIRFVFINLGFVVLYLLCKI